MSVFKIPPIYGLFFNYKLSVKWVKEPIVFSANPDKLYQAAQDTQDLRRGSNEVMFETLEWRDTYTKLGETFKIADATNGGKVVPFYTVERLELI